LSEAVAVTTIEPLTVAPLAGDVNVMTGGTTSGTSDRVVEALLVGSATLVAVTVTVWALVTKAGAV
jgi:hypothetical protein